MAHKKTRSTSILSQFCHWIQVSLFPGLAAVTEERLTPKIEQVVRVWEVVAIEKFVQNPKGRSGGRPSHDRCLLARAFIAKTVYDLTTTTALIELLKTNRSLRMLCGFESIASIPSEATFSRAFNEFSLYGLADVVHAALVSSYINNQIIMHISYDSTEVVARERPVKTVKAKTVKAKTVKAKTVKAKTVKAKTVKAKESEKKKRGRPKKGAERQAPEPKRLDIQLLQTGKESFHDLPKRCDFGTKNDTSGHRHTWKGYKAHIAWADGGIPITAATTSASVHDSQVAIPLMRTCAQRVCSLYDLMDSAYDAPQIRQVSEELGHAALINPNPRRSGISESKRFDPVMKERFKERTTAERGNSRLKDEFGLRHVRVRGNAKVHLHLMLGVIALFADQLLKPFTG